MTDILIKAAVVIPVYNRRETTLQGLRSLERINKKGIDLRVFVVDDGSTDGTSEAIRTQFPWVHLIAGNGRLHYAAGTNRGIEVALAGNPDYVVIMNDDTIFHEQFLRRLIETAKANHRSVVGALLLLWNQPHKVFQVGLEWRTIGGGWKIREDLTAFTVPEQPFEVECLVGNCVLVPTDAIIECGMLDERRFRHGWGDVQYTTRMRKAGWRLIVDPKSRVWCEPNSYPQPLHELTLLDTIRILFIDETHPANLKRQFVARWYSAPTRGKALIAFAVYCLLLIQKILTYGIKGVFQRTAST